jgi:SPP1 family predicted phage head-tail adaptor
MPANNPRLDRICLILAEASAKDSDGAPLRTFAPVKTTYCHRLDRGGRERRDSGAKRFDSDCEFTIRFISIPNLTTKHRISCDGRIYEIESLSEVGRRQFWRVAASEVEGLTP